jgi:hypothetical protein
MQRARNPLRLIICCLLAFAVINLLSSNAHADFRVGQAINIAQWFTWPRYESWSTGDVLWPPYQGKKPRPPSNDDLLALRKAGFDTVRLPVDYAPFASLKGEHREAVYKLLLDAIGRMHKAGLNVIVDLHPNSRHKTWGQHAVIEGLEAPAFVALGEVTAEMARRLDPFGDNVALEVMNEPRLKCQGEQQDKWEAMAAKLVAQARTGSRDITLVVTGACVSSLDGLLALNPQKLGDRNLIYTFHFYDPFTFTHQGASFIAWPDKYLDEVPWPAASRPIEQPLARLKEHMETVALAPDAKQKAADRARHNLVKFYVSNAGRGMIEKRFAQVSAWAREHGVPPERILIGEFGVLKKDADKPGALCADRMRWLTDVREVADANGFSWAYFSYDGPFALVLDDRTRKLDANVLRTLGMREGPVRCEAQNAR